MRNPDKWPRYLAAMGECQRLREALQSIASHEHCVYSTAQATSTHDLQYRIGVADGHRCAAEIARAALEALEEVRRG